MEFIKDNYLWFIIFAIIIVLSLLGWYIENDKKKNPKKYEKKEVPEKKPKKDNNTLADLKPGMKLNEVIENNKKTDTKATDTKTETQPVPDNSGEVLIVDEPK